MFADDTNLFYAERDMKKLFKMVNNELQKISRWFILNKLSINVTKIIIIIIIIFINRAKETIFSWIF